MARDYGAEYERRIARGRARGLSVSQARGHARIERGEVPAALIRDARAGKSSSIIQVPGTDYSVVYVWTRDPRTGQFVEPKDYVIRNSAVDRAQRDFGVELGKYDVGAPSK